MGLLRSEYVPGKSPKTEVKTGGMLFWFRIYPKSFTRYTQLMCSKGKILLL